MKIETIETRILKAEEKVTKKEATLARHQKALEKLIKKASEMNPNITSYEEAWERRNENQSAWETCWAWSNVNSKKEDIERTKEAIEEAKESLKKWNEMLQAEIEKANSRDVKIIMEFLETWKERNITFFLKQKKEYDKALVEYQTEQKEIVAQINALGWEASWNEKHENHERFEELCKERADKKAWFREMWMHVTQFEHGEKDWETTMREDLEEEKNRKYDDLIERTNKIVGQITDASRLQVNEKDNLDGFIIGTKGMAKVETIGAGGYNIQCFHFRTLIHEVK